MACVTLIPSPDTSAADWITGSDVPWQRLVTYGPPGFPVYARLRFIPDPLSEGQSENDAVLDQNVPSETARLRTLLETLAGHTSTPKDCYFCLWDGWQTDIYGGDIVRIVDEHAGSIRKGPIVPPAFPPEVLSGPKVDVPNRAYFLFRGKLTDFGDWGASGTEPGEPRTGMPDPAFIWPADHAWCIANDVDPHWAGIGADAEAIHQILADPRLDVVPANPTEDPPRYS